MNVDDPGGTTDLFHAWERRTRRAAIAFAGLAFLVAAVLGALAAPPWLALSSPVAAAALVYAGLTRRIRLRRRLASQPFPPEWEAVLVQDVVFYRALEPPARERFRRLLQVFLGEKRITGIKLELDTTTRVLAAASAIIPIFGFPEWEWDEISEILIYPQRFDEEFSFGNTREHRTLGMVGSGTLNRLMILSRPDLIDGFRNAGDKRNVGIHEFAHLVDKSDGDIDGVPGAGLDRRTVGPWIELMRRKMLEIDAGKSDIDPYAATSPAEFFAVTSEYFFQRPGVMRQKHPQLYAALERVFRQDLRARARAIRREIGRGRPRFGRNSPCPCGSGVKFKKCCRRPPPRTGPAPR